MIGRTHLSVWRVMPPIHIRAEERHDNVGVQRVVHIEAEGGLPLLNGRYLIFRIDRGITRELPVLDCYLPVLSMLAMASGRPLHIHGRVTGEALLNMAEFQEAWVAWKPKLFHRPIEIVADEVIDHWQPVGPACAIQAYSGGLDAMFTTWTHRVSDNHAKRRPLHRAVFAHGFDIALKDQNAFSLATEKARRVLDSVGVELSTVRTNLRAATRINWELIHGAALAAILGQFTPDYSIALIGSSGSYTSLKIPWGSGPITDHLMSGAAMRFVHDGAGATRLEKIRAIADWQVAAESLRVCWHATNQWENCGTCDKCVRTALGFRAWGLPIPGSFKATIEPADIDAFLHSPRISLDRVRELHALAVRNGVRDPWVRRLREHLIARKSPNGRAAAPDAISKPMVKGLPPQKIPSGGSGSGPIPRLPLSGSGSG